VTKISKLIDFHKTKEELSSPSLIDLADTFAGKKVLEFDETDTKCQLILQELENVINSFSAENAAGKEFDVTSNFRTKVTAFVRREILRALKKSSFFSVEKLAWNRYPNLLLEDHEGNYTYLLVKSSTRDEDTSTVRDIYFSKDQRINYDGYHLALMVNYYQELSEDVPMVVFDFVQILDLSKIDFNIKIEYNAVSSNAEVKKRIDC
jgi:hypothetical protein